ncbi:MAG: sugar phosphate isomerase/epimerase [Burkholderiales bacterium]|nr:sugar phosphate isomerase/epimerase [Burkholderiales bacterium]
MSAAGRPEREYGGALHGGDAATPLRARVFKGFSSQWSGEQQLDELLPNIAAAGFDGIEPTFNPGAYPSPEGYRRQAPELRLRCEALGLRVHGLRAGRFPWANIPSPDARDRAAALEHIRRALECVSIMGGDVLLVVPGQARPDVGYAEHWHRVVDFARAAGELAAARGLTIGLENVEARFPLSVRDWKDLLLEIDHPQVRMYLDVGNVTWLGLGFPAQWIRELGRLVCRLHFKDASFGGGLRNLLAGEVDWSAVAAALRETGYAGWISVEPEWYRHAPARLAERLSRDLDAILDLEGNR